MDHWKIRKRFVDTRASKNDEEDIEYRLVNWLQQLQKDQNQVSYEKHTE